MRSDTRKGIWSSTASLVFAALAHVSTAHAGPVVTLLPDGSPASASVLVDALLSPSSALTVVGGSAEYIGAPSASGTFVGGNASLPTGVGINSGVVLTTGDARFLGGSAAFPGDSANKSVDFTAGVGNGLTPNNSPGNALFNSLTSFATSNASILSFQFVPQFHNLLLSFVFGSEDYNDLVNTGFPTDVIGIFVNGVNHALVPGTNLAISASTINCGGPTSGPAPGSGPNCALFRDNPPFFDTIDSELDGFTVAFDVSIPVLSGQVNTISIGIADNLDDVGDSALLLRAGSVVSIPAPSSYALMLAGIAAVLVARRRRLC